MEIVFVKKYRKILQSKNGIIKIYKIEKEKF